MTTDGVPNWSTGGYLQISDQQGCPRLARTSEDRGVLRRVADFWHRARAVGRTCADMQTARRATTCGFLVISGGSARHGLGSTATICDDDRETNDCGGLDSYTSGLDGIDWCATAPCSIWSNSSGCQHAHWTPQLCRCTVRLRHTYDTTDAVHVLHSCDVLVLTSTGSQFYGVAGLRVTACANGVRRTVARHLLCAVSDSRRP